MFSNNLEKIIKHNKEAAEGTHTYTLGINQFSDLTEAEFRKTFTMNGITIGEPKLHKKSRIYGIPDAIDWRDAVILNLYK